MDLQKLKLQRSQVRRVFKRYASVICDDEGTKTDVKFLEEKIIEIKELDGKILDMMLMEDVECQEIEKDYDESQDYQLQWIKIKDNWNNRLVQKREHFAKYCKSFIKCMCCSRKDAIILCPTLHTTRDQKTEEDEKSKEDNNHLAKNNNTTPLQTLVVNVYTETEQNINDIVNNEERDEINLMWNGNPTHRKLMSTKKLEKITGYYDEVIKDWERECVVEFVENNNSKEGHYLPHHYVIKDRKYVKLHWWKDIKKKYREIATYQHARVPFGVTCSPWWGGWWERLVSLVYLLIVKINIANNISLFCVSDRFTENLF